MKSLQSFVSSRAGNNLNAIRLFLALLVVFDHSFPLATAQNDPLLVVSRQLSFGELAVHLFFFISGFLITASWFNSRSMNDYLRRRVLRIFPGYTVALFFSFLVAVAFAVPPFDNFAARLKNLTDIFYLGFSSCTGEWVFPNNPYPHTANGSLWTIHFEFTCYLVIAAIGLFGFLRKRVAILILFLALFGYCAHTLLSRGSDLMHVNRAFTDMSFLMIFLAGACAWLWRDRIFLHSTLALLAVFLLIGLIQFPPWFTLLVPVAAGYVILWIGYVRPLKRLAWCNKTDLSYGTYLYAFPIQQMLALAGLRNPWLLFAIATPLTLAIALGSWTFVEKPCLRMKSKNFSDYDPGAAAFPAPAPLPAAGVPVAQGGKTGNP